MTLTATTNRDRFVKLAADSQVEAIDQAQARIDAAVVAAIIAAFGSLAAAIVLRRMVDAIKTDGPFGALAELSAMTDNEAVFRTVADAARDRTLRAAQVFANLLPIPGREAPLTFSPLAGRYVDFERTRETRILQRLIDPMREGARIHVLEGLRGAQSPNRIARQLKQRIGLNFREMQAVRRFEAALAKPVPDSAVLNRELRDKRFDGTIRRSRRTGKRLTAAQIRRQTERYADRTLRARAKRIAQTEGTMGASAANQMVWEQAADEGRIPEQDMRRDWVTQDDGGVREAHIQIPGLNPDGRGMNEPFDTPLGPMMFPGDPAGTAPNRIGCRCRPVITLR